MLKKRINDVFATTKKAKHSKLYNMKLYRLKFHKVKEEKLPYRNPCSITSDSFLFSSPVSSIHSKILFLQPILEAASHFDTQSFPFEHIVQTSSTGF